EMANKLTKVFPAPPTGPTIEANVSGQQSIIVRGTPDQIDQVRKAAADLEGIPQAGTPGANLSPFKRTIPLPSGSTSVLAEHLARMFADMNMNPVIVQDPTAPPKPNKPILQAPAPSVTPGALSPAVPNGPGSPGGPAPAPGTVPQLPPGMLPGAMPPGMTQPGTTGTNPK